jgi:hypothetical protein
MHNTTNNIELARMAEDGDDDVLLSATAMSLLLGVSVADIERLRADRCTSTMYLPKEWVKQGKRRTKEAQAYTGDNDMLGGLAYWAAKDYGAAIEIDTYGAVFMASAETA